MADGGHQGDEQDEAKFDALDLDAFGAGQFLMHGSCDQIAPQQGEAGEHDAGADPDTAQTS